MRGKSMFTVDGERLEIVIAQGFLQHRPTCDCVTSQGQERPDFAVNPGQEVACSDVGAIANFGLRHGKNGFLSRYSELSIDSETDTASHYTGRQFRASEKKSLIETY